MTFNTMIDLSIGIIPFVGDIFDFFSNPTPETWLSSAGTPSSPRRARGPHRAFFAGLALILIGTVWLTISVLDWFFGLLLQPLGA